jgi:hypothetical protein
MPSPASTEIDPAFINQIKILEEKLFPELLETEDNKRLKSDGKYFWHYKPSHHAATGLITPDDVPFLQEPGRRLLSLGAHPAYFERIVLELGVPADHMLVTDTDPRMAEGTWPMPTMIVDFTKPWPNIGVFDRIIFPESLCIAVRHTVQDMPKASGPHPYDAAEAQVLACVLGQALSHLAPGGSIRANGPMSHPNVVQTASEQLQKLGQQPLIGYQRYFLTVQASTPGVA